MAHVLKVDLSQVRFIDVNKGSSSIDGQGLYNDYEHDMIFEFEVILRPNLYAYGQDGFEEKMEVALDEMNEMIHTALSTISEENLGLDAGILDLSTSKSISMENGRLLLDNVVQDNNYPEADEEEDFDALDSAKPASLTAEDPASQV